MGSDQPLLSSSCEARLCDQEEYDNDLNDFCRRLPKLEVHAHLNGSIPRQVLSELVEAKSKTRPDLANLELPEAHLDRIEDFFDLLKLIYELNDTPESVKHITMRVIEAFRDDGVMYLELRTTPRDSPYMSKEIYLLSVLDAISSLDEHPVIIRLIVSCDRRMNAHEAIEVVNLAIRYRHRGVVGIDLCGDVSTGHVATFIDALTKAKENGLKLTLHFAEVPYMVAECSDMLALDPDRLGHATLISDDLLSVVKEKNIAIEVCQSSNVLTKTVTDFANHHLGKLLLKGIPPLICTDDILVFNSTSSNEYLVAMKYFELSKRDMITKILLPGVNHLFCDDRIKDILRHQITNFAKIESIDLL